MKYLSVRFACCWTLVLVLLLVGCRRDPHAVVETPKDTNAPLTDAGSSFPQTPDECLFDQALALFAPWPLLGRCPQNSRVSGSDGVTRAGRKWSVSLKGTPKATPVVDADGTVYVGTDKDRFYAIPVDGGEPRWVRDLGAPIATSGALGRGERIYVGTASGAFFALSTETGETVWRIDLGSAPRTSPLLTPDGHVLLGTEDATVVGLKMEDGELRFEASLPGPPSHMLTVGADGELYAVADETLLRIVFDPEHGYGAEPEVEALYEAAEPFVDAPLVDPSGRVHAVTQARYLSMDDGELAEERDDLGKLTGLGALDSQRLLLTTESGLFAVLTSSGEVDWFQSDLGSQIQPHPVVGKDGTFCVTLPERTLCFDAEGASLDDGLFDAELKCGGSPHAQGSAAGLEHTIIIPTLNGLLACGDCGGHGDCPGGVGCGKQKVCHPELCRDQEHPAFACGLPQDTCGERCPDCATGAPNCRPKACNPKKKLCGQGQSGCRSTADCEAGLVCGVDNGERFGFKGSTRACWPALCEAFVVDTNNCGFLSDPCGRCPVCEPDCSGKTCGDDGCGGSCGETAPNEYCNASGHAAARNLALQVDAAGAGANVTAFNRGALNSFDALPEPVTTGIGLDLEQETATVGALPAVLSVSPFGQAQWDVPIVVPPGRAGIEPALSIHYSHDAPNGYLGQGFSVTGLSAISLCQQDIHQDGQVRPVVPADRADRRFCLDGQRLVLEDPSATYGADGSRYRTAVDSYTQVISHGAGPDWFEARASNGRVLTFAQRVEAGDTLPDGERPTLTWALTKVEDRIGNTMHVEYAYLSGMVSTGFSREYFPTVIRYTGFGDEEGHAEVIFHYAEAGEGSDEVARKDQLDSFVGGTRLIKSRLLRAIETRVEDRTVREYRLRYVATNVDRPARLGGIQECAQRKSVGPGSGDLSCKPPTLLDYDGVTEGMADEPSTGIDLFKLSDQADDNFLRHLVLDLNNNGVDDLMMPNAGRWSVLLDQTSWINTDVQVARDIPQVFVVDMDQDGRDDVLERTSDALRSLSWSAEQNTLVVMETGIDVPSSVAFATFYDLSGSSTLELPPDFAATGVYVVDLNGDALSDVVMCDIRDSGQPTVWSVRLGQGGGGFAEPTSSELPLTDCPSATVIDLDGDGDQELLGGYDGELWALHLSGETLAAALIEDNWSGTMIPVDFNGDGLVDLAHFLGDGGRIRMALLVSTGRGLSAGNPRLQELFTQLVGVQTLPELTPAVRVPLFTYISRMVPFDVNHDGRTDLLTWINDDQTSASLSPKWLIATADGFVVEDGNVPGREQPGFASAHRALEADGDGVPDIGYLGLDGDEVRWFVRRGLGPIRPRLTRITDGLGATTVVGYETTNVPELYRQESRACAYPIRCEYPRRALVRRLTHLDVGAGEEPEERNAITEYSYLGYATVVGTGQSLGPAVVIARELSTGRQEAQIMGDRMYRDSVTGTYPLAGVVTVRSSAVQTAQGETRTSTVEERYLPDDGIACTEGWRTRTAFPRNLCERTVVLQEGDEPLLRSVEKYQYDEVGSPIEKSTAWADGERLVELTDFKHRTDSAYRDAWLIGLPSRTTSISEPAFGPAATREQVFEYFAGDTASECDGQPSAQQGALTGLLQSTTRAPGVPLTERITTLCRDARGNVTKVRESGEVADSIRQERETQFKYDARLLYAQEIVDDNGHSTVVGHDAGSGQRIFVAPTLNIGEPIWLAEMRLVDGFGRETGLVHADGSFEEISYEATVGGMQRAVRGQGIADVSELFDAWGKGIGGFVEGPQVSWYGVRLGTTLGVGPRSLGRGWSASVSRSAIAMSTTISAGR